MKPGETMSITFAADKPHNGHSDAYEVTKKETCYDVVKNHD